jgi:hypothetical protein
MEAIRNPYILEEKKQLGNLGVYKMDALDGVQW